MVTQVQEKKQDQEVHYDQNEQEQMENEFNQNAQGQEIHLDEQ